MTESTRVAIKTVRRWMEIGNNKDKIDKIVFACYRQYEVGVYHYYLSTLTLPLNVPIYEKWMQKYFPTSLMLSAPVREIQGEQVVDDESDLWSQI